jgi:hypothetical protein
VVDKYVRCVFAADWYNFEFSCVGLYLPFLFECVDLLNSVLFLMNCVLMGVSSCCDLGDVCRKDNIVGIRYWWRYNVCIKAI